MKDSAAIINDMYNVNVYVFSKFLKKRLHCIPLSCVCNTQIVAPKIISVLCHFCFSPVGFLEYHVLNGCHIGMVHCVL